MHSNTDQKKIIVTNWKCQENSFLKKREIRKNSKMSTMLLGIDFVWQRKH